MLRNGLFPEHSEYRCVITAFPDLGFSKGLDKSHYSHPSWIVDIMAQFGDDWCIEIHVLNKPVDIDYLQMCIELFILPCISKWVGCKV